RAGGIQQQLSRPVIHPDISLRAPGRPLRSEAPDGRPSAMRSVPFFICFHHWHAASCFADETAKAAAGSPRRGRNQHPLTERGQVVHGLHQQLTSYGSSYGNSEASWCPAFFDVAGTTAEGPSSRSTLPRLRRYPGAHESDTPWRALETAATSLVERPNNRVDRDHQNNSYGYDNWRDKPSLGHKR